jgi:class 3 adenylate cyclase
MAAKTEVNEIAAEFIDLGDRQLKNIARPVRAYRVESLLPAPPSQR